MSNTETSSVSRTEFSLPRLVVTIVVVLIIAAGAYWYGKKSVQLPIAGEDQVLKNFGIGERTTNRLDSRFADSDANLVADPPTNADDWIDPETLHFSYGSTQQGYHHTQEVWADLMQHISEQTGKQVEFVAMDTPLQQILALSEGQLHVAGVNPGNVPLAVNTCGYVPTCTVGKDGKLQNYTMQIIVPSDSKVTNPEELGGATVTLTSPSSNSGWKAPLVVLMRDFGLQPIRDYVTNYSTSHIKSIMGVATGEFEAAAVASTEIVLAVERGDIDKNAIRVIYESDPFPYDCIGYVYNLKPELAEKVREAILSFDWSDTTLEAEFSPLGFNQHVALSYKDDLALVREIDDAMGREHSLERIKYRVESSR